ncbi:hypothetical protein HS088_TW08G00544 [Tripterygium wilfordii]|uniref:Uncharacterized protein n=1 Tax=Tripterygium wilfordii TaxID=458696 RepID=A0A7J7DD10_TRIWF|nr:hypothetical protein HS088_TW08G00544 [Tripterygium wilfordii]
MGTESNPTSKPASAIISTPTSSPSGKRSRDPEDEVYLDNLHSHNRYLTEIDFWSVFGFMAASAFAGAAMGSKA